MIGLSRDEVEILGRYNAEVDRGVAHTPEWQHRMAELQARFDAKRKADSETPLAIALRNDLRRLDRAAKPILDAMVDSVRRINEAFGGQR